ncbi:CD59 glycoprotein-like [Epinephelus moara]|uniref:CD59 glycoprotein-like n=1 Tax=Epinephelus moara TaxID=300413 RepID=UPI00214EDAF7|nr:CD59 glycoprotein-like [Epinephelus moara]
MQWFGALILFMTLSAAFGLRCHVCIGKSCTRPTDCPPNFDRCATAEVNGEVVKSCMLKNNCVGPIKCCEGDLCNSDQTGEDGTKPPGPTSKPPAPTSKAPVLTPNPPGTTPKPPGPTPKPPGPTSKPTGSSNIPTGSSVLLLLASSGIITLLL